MNDERDSLVAELRAQIRQLEARVQELSRDALTGVWGRGVLDHALGTELARARRFGRHLGLLMVDVDHFKAVNDTHGHPVGDRTLQAVAETLQRYVRDCDTLARYGGEEFCILVDNASRDGLLILGERVRGAVETTLRRPAVTVSVGCALSTASDTPVTLLERADRALYAAKDGGRNRVCMESR